MPPTPAVAAAERSGVAFALHEYELDPHAGSFGLEAAAKLGRDPGSGQRHRPHHEPAPHDLVRLTGTSVASIATLR